MLFFNYHLLITGTNPKNNTNQNPLQEKGS
jgi:hypothetical protein